MFIAFPLSVLATIVAVWRYIKSSEQYYAEADRADSDRAGGRDGSTSTGSSRRGIGEVGRP